MEMQLVSEQSSLVHRFAVATAVLALLPIGVGALVTTLGAGMAFLDWPTSDGENMLLYPWLKDLSAGNTDKFVEHSHRLAGMLIGMTSIVLAGLVWRRLRSKPLRILSLVVLGGVIVQGLLGGARVIADERLLAMLHGSLAAVVFTLMCALAMFTGHSWTARRDAASDFDASRLMPLAIITPLVVGVQYLLGGLVRHLGTTLFEHIGLAVLVLVFVVATAVAAYRSGSSFLRRSATMMLFIVLLQLAIGVGTFATKYGFAPTGYVAVQHSTAQIVFRSSHTVVGMLLLTTTVLHAVRIFGLRTVNHAAAPVSGALSLEGGVR